MISQLHLSALSTGRWRYCWGFQACGQISAPYHRRREGQTVIRWSFPRIRSADPPGNFRDIQLWFICEPRRTLNFHFEELFPYKFHYSFDQADALQNRADALLSRADTIDGLILVGDLAVLLMFVFECSLRTIRLGIFLYLWSFHTCRWIFLTHFVFLISLVSFFAHHWLGMLMIPSGWSKLGINLGKYFLYRFSLSVSRFLVICRFVIPWGAVVPRMFCPV